ncbi:MAG: NUDIX domain-containing protein [Salegentibacter sp.]
MALNSAGILMYRIRNDKPEVFLVHPGGPFFAKKDKGAWTIPKGLPENEEELKEAARREFKEETGIEIKEPLYELGKIIQKGGKVVHAWAAVGDIPRGYELRSNLFELEWPPRSGKKQEFPEIDKGGFFGLTKARELINPAQEEFLDRLAKLLEKRE